MRGSREEKVDSASSGEDEESLRELCTVNGIKFEKLQKGAGKNVASLEMFFSGFPKIIGMENFPDLQNLTLMGQQITTLENLECLPNLTELCVSESKITAISGLDGCKKLKKLFLYDNKITKIENISHLEQLNVLWLNNNNIIAIEGLEKLLYLLDLNLAGNKITEIGNSLNGNLNLKTLNLSANCIASLKDLTNLSQLPCLESLSLKDPVYGPNPVALLCNYSTHLLFHLPNLKRVDSYNVDDKTLKELAETTVVKKKMYYNMRVKTMQRNKADLLFRLETERATLQAEPRNRMLKLFSAVKDIEREVEEQREGLSSSFKENKNPISPVAGDEGKKENLEEKETLATDTMMFLQTLQKKKEALLKRISKLQRQREEYKSCHDLVFSRFCVGDYLGLGISGIKVPRITRIHNRILRTRFDDKLDLILDRDDVSELTQYVQVNT